MKVGKKKGMHRIGNDFRFYKYIVLKILSILHLDFHRDHNCRIDHFHPSRYMFLLGDILQLGVLVLIFCSYSNGIGDSGTLDVLYFRI